MHMQTKKYFNTSILCMAIISALLSEKNDAYAREYFDPSFINSVNGNADSPPPDLSMFESKNAQAPGEYRVDIMLNGRYIETKNIKFVIDDSDSTNNSGNLKPCLNINLLSQYGVKIKSFPGLIEDAKGCANLNAIPEAQINFDFSSQRLIISIPQAAMVVNAQGYIPPEQFDDGINALMMNYQFSSAQDSQSNDEHYNLNLQSGVNFGAWRIRNYSTWNKNNGDSSKWDSVYLYMQRSIRTINSNVIFGESSSLSSIFDSVPFTGIQVATDTTMLPESMRGYAPVIRGIAKTNARVVIKQNDYQVYQTYVAPGAFEITDMYPSGGSGDLYVTVEESDGTTQEFVVPFATLPVMVRENYFEYEVTSGKYRPYDGNVDEQPFTQATATYGVSTNATVYGGIQGASHYQALSAGLGYNLGEWGAMSLDVTHAWSKKKEQDKQSGQSWRIRYGKNILQTGTNVTIAGYRYSTKGFNTLTEVLDTYSDDSDGINYSSYSLKNRTNLTLNQSLGKDLGSLSISGIIEDYWDNQRTNKSISVGYNGGWRGINYYLGYSYNRYTWDSKGSSREARDDQRISLTVTVPFSNWLTHSYASYQVVNTNPGSTDQFITLGGSGLENDKLDWSIQQGYGNREHYSGNVRATYDDSFGTVNAGYGYDKDSRRLDYGLSGSIIAHADGITLGQSINDSAVLIKAPGLSHVQLSTDNTIETDYRGYAVVPYVTPYRRTDITLDSTSLGDEMELPETTKQVIPTRGAIVRANYAGNIGKRAFAILKTPDGKYVPYGATVTYQTNERNQTSIVSDAGMVYLSGLQDNGIITVQWGNQPEQKCTAKYNLSGVNGSILQTTAVCI